MLTLSLLLVAGAIVNVTVAWGFAARRESLKVERNQQGTFVIWGRPWNVVLECRFGMVDVWWYDLHDENSRSIPAETLVEQSNAKRKERQESGRLLPSGRPVQTLSQFPTWGSFREIPSQPDIAMRGDIAFGLPLLSLWMSTTNDVAGNVTRNERLHGAWLVRGQVDARGNRFIAVPYRVLWPGFAINTIFYAAILWVVFFAPGRIRRTIRRRRGLCPACAYPIGTSPICTECGAAVPVTPRPSHS